MNVRYAYAITTALLVGGAAITMGTNTPVGAQTAENTMAQGVAPRPGAPVSFADLTARSQPAVVNISTKQTVQVQAANPFANTPFADLFGQFGNRGQGGQGGGRPATREAQSLGSGFIISSDGYIVTNNHVISPGQGAVVDSITVTLTDRKEYVAKLIGRDQASDLALLKIEGQNLPYVKFGDSTQTRVGDWVVAIGNPFGLGGTVTAGIVSALHRNTGQGGPSERYIQTDASINFGNSGGPMFDMNGNVIGINSAIFSPSGGNVGIGFAIPSEQAKPIIDTLRAGNRVQRGYLGVALQPLDDSVAAALGLNKNRGELIAQVVPGEAAAKAGIQQGDVIVKVNNREVNPEETLSFIVSNLSPGTKVAIELIRNEKRMVLNATVGQRPPEDQLANFTPSDDNSPSEADKPNADQATQDALGLAVQALTPTISRQLGLADGVRGVVIGAVDPDSDAGQQGLQRGDVILSANQRPTLNPGDLSAGITAAQKAGRPNVLLLIQRGNGPSRYIGVKIRKN